jgi:hypothetical protein
VQAQAAAQRGDPELAFALVEAELRRGGESDEAGELLWTLGRRLGEPARAAGALEGVIRRALRGGREEVALARWRELAAACPDHAVEPGLSAMLLEALLRRGELRELAVRLRGTLERLDERVPPASALRLLRLARGQGVAGEQVARLASLLVRDAMLPAADRRELEEIVRAAPLGGRALEAGSGG